MNKDILVTAIPSPDETFARALNISKEREAEIDNIINKCHSETDTYPDAIAAVSKELNNANELAYVSFHLGAFAGSLQIKHELSSKHR